MHQPSSPSIMEHGDAMEEASDNLTTIGHGLGMETPEIVDFGGMIGQLGSAIIIIPLIAILESVAIAKAFGESKGMFYGMDPEGFHFGLLYYLKHGQS